MIKDGPRCPKCKSSYTIACQFKNNKYIGEYFSCVCGYEWKIKNNSTLYNEEIRGDER